MSDIQVAVLSRPTPSSPQIAVACLLVALGLCTLPSCGANCQDPKNASSSACMVADAAVDCTGVSSLPTAVAVVEPIVVKLIASARNTDGSINWASIEQQLIDLGLQYGMCVVADVWSNLMGTGSHAVAVNDTRLVPDDLKKEFDRIRARVAPGRTFAVGAGRKL